MTTQNQTRVRTALLPTHATALLRRADFLVSGLAKHQTEIDAKYAELLKTDELQTDLTALRTALHDFEDAFGQHKALAARAKALQKSELQTVQASGKQVLTQELAAIAAEIATHEAAIIALKQKASELTGSKRSELKTQAAEVRERYTAQAAEQLAVADTLARHLQESYDSSAKKYRALLNIAEANFDTETGKAALADLVWREPRATVRKETAPTVSTATPTTTTAA